MVGVTPTQDSTMLTAPAPTQPIMSFLSPLDAPVMPSAPASQPAALAVADTAVSQDPGSPIINIEDSDDEGPATKRRKLDDGGVATTPVLVPAVS